MKLFIQFVCLSFSLLFASQQVVLDSTKLESKPIYSPHFEGNVRLTTLQNDEELSMGIVEFDKGARTFWHTHPKGQILIITQGRGYTQERGGEQVALKAGDIVRCPPNVAHWHGAEANHTMSHIAIAYKEDGRSVTWLEKVEKEK